MEQDIPKKSNMINKKIENKIKKLFKDYKVEEDLLDWKSEWDNKIFEFVNLAHMY